MCDGLDRSQIDVTSSGLASERSHKGQGTVRRHSAGTNTVVQDRSSDVRGRGEVNVGKRVG